MTRDDRIADLVRQNALLREELVRTRRKVERLEAATYELIGGVFEVDQDSLDTVPVQVALEVDPERWGSDPRARTSVRLKKWRTLVRLASSWQKIIALGLDR
jgi:hypothetical protein